LVHRLRGGRRTMRDDDEDEDDVDEDDEDLEGDDDDDVDEDDEDDEDDIELDPLDEDEDDEELPESPRRKTKSSSRDELPRTVQNAMDDGPVAALRDNAQPEHRDAVVAAGASVLSLDVRDHLGSLTESLKTMRSTGALTDLHLVCKGGAKLPAHRVILAAASAQLRGMIDNLTPASASTDTSDGKTPTKTRGSTKGPGSGVSELVLDDVDEDCAARVLDFIYTGSVEVSEEQLPGLLGASEKLGVAGLGDACSQHLHKKLSPDNALHMRALGRSLGAVHLFEAAHHLVMEEFLEVAHSNSFLELDEHSLSEIIGSDDLLVNSEKDVLDAVVRWTEAKEPERAPALLRLIAFVRAPPPTHTFARL